jgi:hypothetical protein
MILARELGQKTTSPSNTALAARANEAEGCENPHCKAKKRSTHTTPNCYWPGGGKEGQFPPNFGQKSRSSTANVATAATSTAEQKPVEHFILSAQIPDTPGQSGILIDNEPPTYVNNDGSSVYPHMALVSKSFQESVKGGVLYHFDRFGRGCDL